MKAMAPTMTGRFITAILAVAFAIHISEGVAGAQPPGGVAEELLLLKEETVSIAARHEQPISEAPANVYVITDEDIRHSGATDLPTILRRIPGLEVMQTTGADFNVSARGDNQLVADRMLVLVDGRSIYVDSQGFVYWKAIPVTLPEIKRIEVLKGPASSLYGFNAFDGVVNIITKSPEEMKGTTLQFGGGEYGTITAAAIQAGTYEKLGYRLSVGRDQNNQWRNRDALAFRDNKFNISTEYALSSDAKVLLSGGLVDTNRFDGALFDINVSADKPKQAYAQASYERPNFFLRSWWSQLNDPSRFNTNPLLVNFIQLTAPNGGNKVSSLAETFDVEGQHAIDFASHRFSYGANYRHNSLSFSLFPSARDEDRLGFYLQEEVKATQNLTLVGGARYDLHSEIPGTFSPRLAVQYKPLQDHTFHAAMSIAYRPPTLVESNLDLRTITTIFGFSTTSSTFGSGNLDPEKIVSYELGYQGWYLRHRLRTRVDLFFNHITDLIAFRPVTNALATSFNDNGSADIYGGEAGIEFLATSWLTGFANYSFQEIRQTLSGPDQRGGPRFKANVGLRAESETGLNAEAVIHHVGAATYPLNDSYTAFALFGVVPPDPRVGGYNLLNLRGGYRFWKEKAEVAVALFNALNDRHKEHPLGDTIGSRLMGWLTIKW